MTLVIIKNRLWAMIFEEPETTKLPIKVSLSDREYHARDP